MENSRTIATQLTEKYGFEVFPIKANAKFPPLWTAWPERATSKVVDWPEPSNVGIHCKGLFVIDIDPRNGGVDTMEQLKLIHEFPVTLTVATPSGGTHLFYRLPEGHPGVSNKAHALGPGVDIKSTRGYVVAAGSTVPGGKYRIVVDVPIAPAPEDLVQEFPAFTERERPETMNIPDCDDLQYSNALIWLKDAPRSVKGAGGDDTAFRVACFLRDMGLSYQQACEAMRSEAWDHGCGWRTGRLEEKPIRSAYRYAQGEAGAKAVKPEDFPLVEDTPEEQDEEPEVTSRSAIQIGALAKEADLSRPLVKGLLNEASYAEIFGEPGAGKTFIALDMGFHIATGQPWFGHKTTQGTVLYMAYEGVGGLVKRAKALEQVYGDISEAPLFVHNSSCNLRERDGRKELMEIIRGLPETPKLIVIDTLARAMMGGDENAAQDIGLFNSTVKYLIEATGACVMIIHHSGKDRTKGARGSSALKGALDTEIEIFDRTVISTKQRDIEPSGEIKFNLRPVMVGIDDDGDSVTSCVVEHDETGGGKSETDPIKRLPERTRNALEVLEEMSPNNKPVAQAKWAEECETFLPSNDEARRKGFFRIVQTLKKAGLIEVDINKQVTRRLT